VTSSEPLPTPYRSPDPGLPAPTAARAGTPAVPAGGAGEDGPAGQVGSADRPLKIGLVSDCYVPRLGGIEMQVHDLARHLRQIGHEVVVITPTPGPDVVDGVPVRRVKVPLLPFDIPFTPRTFRVISELLEEEGVDVAHFNGGVMSPVAFVGAGTAQHRGIPTVITAHCLWSYATPLFRVLDWGARWTQWPVVFSAVSDVAAAPIHRIARRGVKVAILPNGIDNDAWRVTPAPRDASVVTIVAVMRLAPRKRPAHLLRMIERVHRQAPPGTRVRAVIIGEGPEREAMDKTVAERGLGHVIELTGRLTRDEIREQFAHADVFVAPANLESFGIAALEARCAGLPVVAKARTGIREFVAHGQEGLLAESDADMVAQLVRLVRDPALRARMARHNRETPSPVDWSRVVHLNVAAYREAIRLRAAHPASAARIAR
jgi:glycosyltransferase involved in cell wall biosynthesis